MSSMWRQVVNQVPYNIKHPINTIIKRLQRQSNQARALTPLKRHLRVWGRVLRWSYQLYIQRRKPILIYQMGKVGSRTVEETLNERGYIAIHTHFITGDWLEPYTDPEVWRIVQSKRLERLWVHNAIIKREQPTQFITPVRDPISIIIASFFQHLDIHMGVENAAQNVSVDELLARFESYQRPNITALVTWFEREVQTYLDINVFEHPFDAEQGHGRITQGNRDVLLYKLELPDERKIQALEDFLGMNDLELIGANIGAKKPYAEIYNAFKAQVRVADDVLDTAYNSTLVRHFYTDAEIARFRAKWQRDS